MTSKKPDQPKNNSGGVAAVKAPDYQNERTYINGREVSSRIYNPGNKTYSSNIYLDDNEKRALDFGRSSFADLLEQVPGQMAVSDDERKSFIDALYQPQARELENTYNKSVGQANLAANASGVYNSKGHHDYLANQLQKNYLNSQSDLYQRALLGSYELPSIKLAPIQQALSIFDTSIQQPTQRGLAQLNPSFTGSQSSSNFDAQRQNFLLNQQMALASMQPQQPPQQSRGFFSSFF